MDFKSFMLEGVDGEFNFLPGEGVSEGRNSPSAKYVNKDAPVIGATPLSSVYPSNIVASEASTPLDVDNDSDIHEFPSAKELRDATDCHWVVAHVTPPSWMTCI
ncbi:hypothetical protein Tco_0408100 [Tanacetum coccineum]